MRRCVATHAPSGGSKPDARKSDRLVPRALRTLKECSGDGARVAYRRFQRLSTPSQDPSACYRDDVNSCGIDGNRLGFVGLFFEPNLQPLECGSVIEAYQVIRFVVVQVNRAVEMTSWTCRPCLWLPTSSRGSHTAGRRRIGSRCAYVTDGETTTRDRHVARGDGDDACTGGPVAEAHD
jgi:hypothetical protein